MGLASEIIGLFIGIIISIIGFMFLIYPLDTMLPKDFHFLIPQFLINTSILSFILSQGTISALLLLFIPIFAIGAFYILKN